MELEEIRAKLSRVVVPIYRTVGRQTVPLGCGFLFGRDGHRFLVTAGHVFAGQDLTATPIGIPRRPVGADPEGFVPLGRAESVFVPDGHDVCIVRLDHGELVAALDAGDSWVVLSDGDVDSFSQPPDRCALLGWPADDATVLTNESFAKNVVLREMAWMETPEDIGSAYPVTPATMFFAWPADAAARPFQGISGSPIFAIRSRHERVVFSRPELRLLGVQTHTRPGIHVRATRWGQAVRRGLGQLLVNARLQKLGDIELRQLRKGANPALAEDLVRVFGFDHRAAVAELVRAEQLRRSRA